MDNEVTEEAAHRLAGQLRQLADAVERKKPHRFQCEIKPRRPAGYLEPNPDSYDYATVKIEWW